MRDICRLLTSASPSLSNLSGSGFSTTSSIVLDNTPAGWTYVGSNNAADRPTIAGAGAANVLSSATPALLAVSAPMADYAGRLKYAIFTYASTSTGDSTSISLSAAESVTSLGVATNPGARSNGAAAYQCFFSTAGSVFHLIASARHITLIREGAGLSAVWETTSTPAHDFYGVAAFCQHIHVVSSATSIGAAIAPATYAQNAISSNTFAITDVNTGTRYGVVNLLPDVRNRYSLAQNISGARSNSTDSTGAIKYQISPVYFQIDWYGYPNQFISGVVPIYWCKADLGTTGDSVLIGNDEYTYFNCGTTTFGVLMKTS